jgi:hypothetical protein
MATVANDFNLNFKMFKDSLLAPYWSHLLHPPTSGRDESFYFFAIGTLS